jgi:hypothetical protein
MLLRNVNASTQPVCQDRRRFRIGSRQTKALSPTQVLNAHGPFVDLAQLSVVSVGVPLEPLPPIIFVGLGEPPLHPGGAGSDLSKGLGPRYLAWLDGSQNGLRSHFRPAFLALKKLIRKLLQANGAKLRVSSMISLRARGWVLLRDRHRLWGFVTQQPRALPDGQALQMLPM